MTRISEFVGHHYRHFNSATLVDAADGYARHVEEGGKMLVAMAGAMSTAEIGLSLAEMIRQDKVHAICCTGANLIRVSRKKRLFESSKPRFWSSGERRTREASAGFHASSSTVCYGMRRLSSAMRSTRKIRG